MTSSAHAAAVEHSDQRRFRRGAPGRADCDAFDETHGRLVRRRVFASADAATLDALSGWPGGVVEGSGGPQDRWNGHAGLRTALAGESIRSVNDAPAKVESEIRYFLSSCPGSPGVLGQAIRSHWAEAFKAPPAKPVEQGRREWRTRRVGCWTSPSASTTAGRVIAPRPPVSFHALRARNLRHLRPQLGAPSQGRA